MGRMQTSSAVIRGLCIIWFAVFVIAAFVLNASDFNVKGIFFPRELRVPQLNTVTKVKIDPCGKLKLCPDEQFSFSISSGAASVVQPKICLQNQLILGNPNKNSGVGINIAVVNGKTGKVQDTGNFDMYGGEIEPLIKFLKTIEKGSVVLIASFDEPATKLNSEARKLIADLGSSAINSIGFRDNWIFVGGKGITSSHMEKLIKNKPGTNKYDGWPEMIELDGCIPQYME
ncbi:protein FAM3C-like [Hypomesus transpacificus]|uniref:protein FAM3C-like n=1 Tax=Hypomesus transpacificus TaxID=137520 RepID=UPI001F073611|nr:protein FAM3C-like [Hypomesus transpacificus]